MTGLLCYLGVGSYQFIVAPLEISLVKKANLSRRVGLIAMMVSYNAVTYCLPGTAVTPNVLPTTILGTNIYAGAGLGILAFVLSTGLGLAYVYWLVHKTKAVGVGFEGKQPGMMSNELIQKEKSPAFWNAIVTVIILFACCFIFSGISALTATQAVCLAQLVAAIWAFVTCFGAVIQSTAAFKAILGGLLSMNVTPYVLTFIGVAIISGCMANGTGAIAMVLSAFAPTLTASGADMGAVHRLSTITCSTFDSLPHCTNVCVSLQVFGLSHKQGYKDVFCSTVLIPELKKELAVQEIQNRKLAKMQAEKDILNLSGKFVYSINGVKSTLGSVGTQFLPPDLISDYQYFYENTVARTMSVVEGDVPGHPGVHFDPIELEEMGEIIYKAATEKSSQFRYHSSQHSDMMFADWNKMTAQEYIDFYKEFYLG